MSERANQVDEIRLTGVQVSARIGVPDEERRLPQTLEVDLVLIPERGFSGLSDDLTRTVDYEAVWTRLREIAMDRPRKLIETLADEVASQLLREFAVREVGVEIRKSILPGTHRVGVRIRRQRSDA